MTKINKKVQIDFDICNVKTAARNIALIIAFSFMLMHNVIPHHHHDEITLNEDIQLHSTAEDIIDSLKLALHIEVSEDYEQAVIDIRLIPSVVFSSSLPLQLLPLSDLLSPRQSPEVQHHLVPGENSASPRRGPPCV